MHKYLAVLKRIFSLKKCNVPVILQLSDTECGIASLAMVFSYYKFDVSLEKLRDKCGVSRDGCKAQTLINVAKSYGFSADAYKTDIDEINDFTFPIIAYWNFNHYVVIKEIGSKKVFINDPAHGATAVSMEEFDKAFTGIIINITPLNNSISVKRQSRLRKFTHQWMSKFFLELCFLLLCLLVMSFVPYLSSILSNIFVDQCIISRNRSWIPDVIFLTIVSAAILISTNFIHKKVQFKLYSKASLLKSSEIILHILQLPMLFYSLRQRSEIVSLLARAESVINLLFKIILNYILGLLASVFCFICMMKLNFILSLVSVSITLISITVFYFISKINFLYEKSNINSSGKLYSHSISCIRNIETVKACGLKHRMLKKWSGLFFNKVQIQDKINILGVVIQSLNTSYHSISMLFLLCFGGYQVSSGEVSVGNLMGCYSLHLIFYNNISYIFQSLVNFQNVSAFNTRINDIVSYEKDNRFITSIKNIEINRMDSHEVISLSNVTFYYNINSLPVLQNININVKYGEHIAFVGDTGSGKSSLLKLICGFYKPNFGEIKFFGKDLLSYSADQLAKICAYVPQNISLFSGTILRNLTFSNEYAEMSIINKSINDVCLTDLIAARKLNGFVEEKGSNFSGGEKQRIDIARALIQNVPILILDEATSALDQNTEKNVINNLRNTGKTIIFVAHRLATIKHCDQIFVINNGRIVEYGFHQDLINNRGYYYSMIEKETDSGSSIICH